MKNYLHKMLQTFGYFNFTELGRSLAPSFKYNRLTAEISGLSTVSLLLDKVFGLDGLAFVALLMVFMTELVSGISAAHYRKETISSMKLSRFSFKVAYYLVLIFVPYAMSCSFKNHQEYLAATIFGWMHTFLLIQIVIENIVSVLENMAVLSGKDKAAWISKIQDKINHIF